MKSLRQFCLLLVCVFAAFNVAYAKKSKIETKYDKILDETTVLISEKFWGKKSPVLSSVSYETALIYFAGYSYFGKQPSKPISLRFGMIRNFREMGGRHEDMHSPVWEGAKTLILVGGDNRFTYPCVYAKGGPDTNRNMLASFTDSWERIVVDIPVEDLKKFAESKKDVGFGLLSENEGRIHSQEIPEKELDTLRELLKTIQ